VAAAHGLAAVQECRAAAHGRARARVRRAVVRAAVAALRAAVAAAAVAADGAKGDTTMRFEHKERRGAVPAFVAALAALTLFVAGMPAALAELKTFASPEAAMEAFGTAVATSDDAAIDALLGADHEKWIPPVGAEVRYRFLAEWAKSHAIKREGDAKALVAVGNDGWTLPIPIVKTPQGWRFDTRAGADEIRIRRIGRNELAVQQVLLAIFDAQKEYASIDRDGDGLLEYATKLSSSPGKRDGLYWPTKSGEPQSPLGPLVATAQAAGGSSESGYYGYRYKTLVGQGKNAPGGAYDYVARGRNIGGFAAVAWPVKYGDTGVMTLMVNHDGVLYQKDLGPDTAARASSMTKFDPDSTWTKVEPGM
jgi:hypothetical protein